MSMPSGWKTGTHESVQDLLALKSLLELLLSVCVGFKCHPSRNFDGASYEINSEPQRYFLTLSV